MFDAEVGVGHVAGALLVAGRDQAQLVLDIVEGIEQADIAVAADAKDVGHFFLNQVLGDELAAFHHGHGVSFVSGGDGDHPLFGHFVHGVVRAFAAKATVFGSAIGHEVHARA